MNYEFYITPEEYEIAKGNGISYDILSKRIYCHGWKKERAMNQAVRQQRNDINKWIPVAVKNGININTFKGRVQRGVCIEEAATTPALSSSEVIKRMNGKRTRRFSDEELRRAYSNGISNRLLQARVKELGWSREDALNTPPMSNDEAIKRAQVASPFREMNEIYWNMKKERRTAIEHRGGGNVHANQIQSS